MRALLILGLLCLSGCVQPPPYQHSLLEPCKLHDGPKREAGEMAILIVRPEVQSYTFAKHERLRTGSPLMLLDRRPYVLPARAYTYLECDYRRNEVLPGRHVIHFSWVMYDEPRTFYTGRIYTRTAGASLEFEAIAGRVYSLQIEHPLGPSPVEKHPESMHEDWSCWIEDTGTGEVMTRDPNCASPPERTNEALREIVDAYAACGDPFFTRIQESHIECIPPFFDIRSAID